MHRSSHPQTEAWPGPGGSLQGLQAQAPGRGVPGQLQGPGQCALPEVPPAQWGGLGVALVVQPL